jgi:hypothetical protein
MPAKDSTRDQTGNEFGWPLPKRKQHFTEIKEGSTQQRQISFMDRDMILPVLRVPINLPKYRMLNGRTASAQEEWLAKHPDKPEDFFQQDPESDEVQRVQHELLSKLVSGAGLLTYFKKAENRQKEPVYLDCNGFVINGNRRLCAWRALLKEDPQRYGHLAHIDVIVLPPADDKAIDKLESELQVEPDIRDDYTWDSLANMMKIRQTRHGLDTRTLSEFYRKKESDVKELLDMLDYAAVYLEKRGKSRQWSEVSDKEFAFRQMVKKRESFAKAGTKRLFEEVAFVLIDDPEGGRLYESIPDAHKHFEQIKKALLDVFPVASVAENADLDILGGGDATSTDVPLAQEIGKDEETRKKAHSIIRDIIEMMRLLDKEKKSADFLLSQLQKANGFVQNAITAGLRPESRILGVEQQITAIDQGLTRIRKWLAENA